VLGAGIATAGGSGTIEVTGSITVMEQCSDIDDGGYSDTGQDVVINDEDGTTIAVGEFGPALRERSTCEFEFTVSDVPTDAKFYEVEISHRGAMRYTLAELKQPLGLRLGD